MVEHKECSFCGSEIPPGTGTMYVKKDGTPLFFCSNKCYKNMIELRRVPRKVRWTHRYKVEKESRLKILERDAEKLKAQRELKKAEKSRRKKIEAEAAKAAEKPQKPEAPEEPEAQEE